MRDDGLFGWFLGLFLGPHKQVRPASRSVTGSDHPLTTRRFAGECAPGWVVWARLVLRTVPSAGWGLLSMRVGLPRVRIRPDRRVRVGVAGLVAGVLVLGVMPSAQAATRAAGTVAAIPTSVSAAAPGDVAVNGWGDGSGYHLDVATSGSGYAWRAVAVLRPAGIDDSSWTGYQCVSGDGRYAAVAVLPVLAVNRATARDHGAFAFSVDLRSGTVRPVASGWG